MTEREPIRRDRFYVRIGLQRVPFTTPTDPRYANLDDYAQCVICGAIMDVGGELTQHASEHL